MHHCALAACVWALDVVGLFMYGELFHVALELVPALGSLLVMVFSARVTIPTLSTSTSVRNILPAGLLLALGMLAGHFLLARSYVAHFAEVNGLAIVLSIATAAGVACYTAIRHRAGKMSALTQRYAPQNWLDNLHQRWRHPGTALVAGELLPLAEAKHQQSRQRPGAAGGAAGDYLRLGGRSIPKHPL